MSNPTPRWPTPDCRAIRAQLGLSQSAFAALLCVSVRAVQDWEQGQRKPRGPSAKLLEVAARRPDALVG